MGILKLFTEFGIAEVFSLVCAASVIIGTQRKSMAAILFWQSLGNVTVALSYLLNGGVAGFFVCMFAVLQGVVMFFYNKKDRKPHTIVLVAFILVSIACSTVTAIHQRAAFEIFAAAGAILYTLSIAQQRPALSRLIYLFNPICWMCYDVFTGSLFNLIIHLAVFIFTGVGILRVDILGKKKEQSEKEENA